MGTATWAIWEVAEAKWEVKSLEAKEVPLLGVHLAHGSNNPKDNKPVVTGEIPGVNKEVAKGNNNNKEVVVVVMAVVTKVAGTTKANNKEEVTLAVRIGADFVKNFIY